MGDNPPQVGLHVIDYIVMAVYMVGLLGLGLYYRRFAQSNLENYFLGGRNLKGWVTGTSHAVTCMNSDVAPAYCGMTVVTGLFICWWYIARWGPALLVGGILFAVFWRRLKIFTSPEFYELRFHGVPAITMRSWVALRSAFIANVAWTGSGLIGMAKISEAVLGWGRWQTFSFALPIIFAYVFMSGYMGVVASDVIQTFIMILASLVLFVLVWIDFGGPAGLYETLHNQFGPEVVSWHPPLEHSELGLLALVVWSLGTAIGYGGDVAPMGAAVEGQRLLSCRNAREASKMYLWSLTMMFLMLLLLTLPALGAMARWPGLHDGTINQELSYGMMVGHYLPTGLLGLALVAMFASIMSSVDSYMNFGAQVFINDIYRRHFKNDASLRHYMRVGKVVMVVMVALALIVATRVQNIISIVIFMLGLSSTELTANWGQWWWWRFNGPARLAASIGGPIIYLLNYFVVFRYWIHTGDDPTYAVILTSIVMTLLLWVSVALTTRPEPTEHLVDFYRRARPLGWWGPIARQAGVEPMGSEPIFSGLFAVAVGSVMVASATVAISCVYVGQWEVAAVTTAIAVASGLFFRTSYRKVMTMLKLDEQYENDETGVEDTNRTGATERQ